MRSSYKNNIVAVVNFYMNFDFDSFVPGNEEPIIVIVSQKTFVGLIYRTQAVR